MSQNLTLTERIEMIKDGRGQHMKKVSEEKFRIIKEWFENVGGTMKECKEETGISYTTIKKYVPMIKKELKNGKNIRNKK